MRTLFWLGRGPQALPKDLQFLEGVKGNPFVKRFPLRHRERRATGGGLGALDAHGERLLHLVHVGDDQDALKVRLNGLDDVQDAIAALRVLGAEPLVDEQRGQWCARPPGQ